ncbi:NADPH oxidase [Patellaria atrata CBS 101060]|uniref:NADPH oxidase n=1 Tax=Patellaria atrata CBS 101060 TaxID=1346257 RepID=A0A9P4VSJ0_9PEZI|nr:NADPH oxidase [Patellaria atrata CBS 101060]
MGSLQKEYGLSGKERSRWPPLTRMLMSGEMSNEPPRQLYMKEKIEIWMVNEGYRRLFVGVFILLHGMVFAFGFMNYQIKDNLTGPRATFGLTYPIARSAALVLHVDIALILFPVCRNLISLARRTPLNGIIQFDKNITFHKLTAWSIVFFSWVHTIAHWNNLAQFAAKLNLGFKGFLLANVATGPGWSGYIMLIALMAMVFTSIEKPRRANYERFWYTHHLFIIFFVFWSIHGAFCMITPDFAPFCNGIGVFWQFWMWGGFAYLAERIAREVRGRHKTFVSKVIQHPSNVCEIQIKKEHTTTRAGQYIFLCCPEVSVWQYHPFTLTSAPEEDYISVHVRCVGNFTKALAKALGCEFERKGGRGDAKGEKQPVIKGVSENEKGVDPSLRKILPRVYIDGPFGSASEDVFKFEVAVLVGAGIGVTPFASILKSIWYRMNYPQGKTRLRKVYFFWICRDFGSFEWFRSLLLAIEAQDLEDHIEIHTYLTARIKVDDATNIMINDANAEQDAITGLRAPTNFGRPNWDMIFKSIRKIHAPAEAGVFFCGPKPLGSVLHIKCNMYSQPGFNFVWGKENF